MTPFRLRALCIYGLLLALFMPQLSVLNAGFGDLESTFFLVGSIVLAILFAAIFRTSLNFSLLVGFLTYALIDVNLASGHWELVAFAGAIVVTFLLIRSRPVEVPLAIAVFALVFSAQYVFTSAKPFLDTREPTVAMAEAGQTNSYFHIILDEQMSPTLEGPLILPIAGREEVVDTYVSRGFKLYSNAHASAHMSYQSITALFGLGLEEDNFVEYEDGPTQYGVANNALIEALLENGFSTTVIQSDFLELCTDDGRVRCSTYELDNDLQFSKIAGFSPLRRIGLSILAVHNRFLDGPNEIFFYRHGTVVFSELNGYRARKHWQFLRPVADLYLLEDVTQRVEDMQPGDALVVHLMSPHFPYVLDRDCNLRDREDWENQLPNDRNATIESAYEGYWDQSICIHRRLARLLDAAVAKEHMTIMVHGDHAARIVAGTLSGGAEDQLASMLAAYGPGTDAGLVTDAVLLEDVLTKEFEAFRAGTQPE